MVQRYIPSLTPLRGIAALMVVIYHFQVLVIPVVDPKNSFLINKWYLMVDFFFLLSGFIITHVYQKKFETGFQWKVFKKFMIARFARLYPLHLATLIIMILLYSGIQFAGLMNNLPLFMQRTLDINAILPNIFLIQTIGLFPEPTWNTPSWSISVEWWTYILFPIFIFMLTKQKRLFKYTASLLTLGVYLSIMYYFQPQQFNTRQGYMYLPAELLNTVDVMVGAGFLRCISGFLMGILVYQLFEQQWMKPFFSRSAPLLALSATLFIGWHFNILPDIISIFLFGLSILFIAHNDGLAKKALSISGFQFLGEISYSIYMIHFPIILTYYLLKGIWKPFAQDLFLQAHASIDTTIHHSSQGTFNWMTLGGLIIFIACTLLLAYVSYIHIERPMRGFLKNRLNKSK